MVINREKLESTRRQRKEDYSKKLDKIKINYYIGGKKL